MKKIDHLINLFRDLKRDDLGLVIVGSSMPKNSVPHQSCKYSLFG